MAFFSLICCVLASGCDCCLDYFRKGLRPVLAIPYLLPTLCYFKSLGSGRSGLDAGGRSSEWQLK